MLYSSQISSKATSLSVVGILQICFGAVFGFTFGAMGLFQLVRTIFWYGMGLGGIVTMLVFLLVGVVLIKRGITNLSLAGHCRKVARTMGDTDRVQLEILARVMHCNQDQAANRIRTLMARSLIGEGYFDLEAREFVLGEPPREPADDTVLREVKNRSRMPGILFLSVWVVYWVFFSRAGLHFTWVLGISLIVYFVARAAIPAKTKVVEERMHTPEPVKVDTGDTAADDLLGEAHRQVNTMVELNRRITNQKINAQVNRLVEVAREILKLLAENPEKSRGARQFVNYYLPTTVKLMENYDILSRQSVKGENIGDTLHKIESMLETLVKAYEKELDDLFRDKAMDISADIEVMQNMIRQGGLADDFFGKPQN